MSLLLHLHHPHEAPFDHRDPRPCPRRRPARSPHRTHHRPAKDPPPLALLRRARLPALRADHHPPRVLPHPHRARPLRRPRRRHPHHHHTRQHHTPRARRRHRHQDRPPPPRRPAPPARTPLPTH